MSEQERHGDDLPGRVDADVTDPVTGPEDAALDAWVSTLLADLPPAEMPAEVWARLESALAAETARAQPADPGTPAAPGGPAPAVTAAHPRLDASSVAPALPAASADVVPIGAGRRSGSARSRWWQGVAAAAVAVLAVGVGVQVLRGGGQPDPVAGPAPAVGGNAAVAIPARQVLASGTAYTAGRLKEQVLGLLGTKPSAPVAAAPAPGATDASGPTAPSSSDPTTGAAAEGLVAARPPAPVGTDGFTASAAGIRDCVVALAGTATVTALVVDRATYEGRDAGVVVLTTAEAGAGGAGDQAGRAASVDVWVVAPECGRSDPHVLFFLRTPTAG